MKKQIAITALCSLFSVSAFAAKPQACSPVETSKIESLFDDWNNALQTGDARKVADKYLPDAVLLPTVSNKVRMTDAERVDYFEHFLANKPVGKIDSRTIRIGCNEAIDTGTYTFAFKDQSSVSARYTFTYAWNGQDWKISTHHSSAMPEK
ncbi:SgcJ/EcaC family oxidoreductase [Pseudomonas gingeri]|nr:SgcJ/EcaC family oxidoreductase [Pseudomonas gingeri]NWA18298.1 SgcJ/EcaC family oxidoreductase [Pseudomonas gingeri]NWA59066.1 SgcJ/EcaC family oxidoreductase [Pseudomonas gingeri]NWA99658.1 SgcJ/EcaC family oxidoreductase [Pseudomonas gingeri]NWB06216.1 SgcJ/EcaC family oxidoreductase [Pseudomonas gingeri]